MISFSKHAIAFLGLLAALSNVAAAKEPSGTARAVIASASRDGRSGDQAPENLHAIMDSLRKMRGFEARFIESKTLALLKAPLESRGRLYYLSPGRLVRKVSTPEPMTISVFRGVVTIEDEQGTRKMDLSSRPGVAAFVESFAHFLDGNLPELEAHFHLRYEVTQQQKWSLQLSPKKAPLNQVVRSITMTGQGQSVVRLSVVETNGDRTETKLTESNTRRVFSAEEKKKIFGVSSP